MSDMAGGKATALFDWAASEGHACLLLDYAGCGLSDGLFADQTLLDWRGDVLDLIDAKAEGPVVIVGSSQVRPCQRGVGPCHFGVERAG